MDMSDCPTCGHRNPADASVCAMCGAALASGPRTAAQDAAEAKGTAAHGPDPHLDDPLAEIEGLLPRPARSSLEEVTAPGPAYPPDEEQEREAALLQRIASESAPMGPPRRGAQTPARRGPSPGVRRLLYLLVLLAALTPLVTGDISRPWVQPRPGVAALAEAMGRIPAGGRVLVALDYGPGFADELNPLAERVLTDLARRGVTLVALGTRPEGVGLARQVLSRAATAAGEYRYGADYVVLGYLPGEERGLRLLTQGLGAALSHDDVLQLPLERLPALEGARALADFDAIVLVSSDAATAQRWIEQVTAQSNVPTHILTTARAEPMLTPYLQAGQVETLVAGAYGALEYPLAGAPEQGGLRGSSDGYLALWGVLALTALLANVRHRHGARERSG
jgi:hypothetical protein